ncbi:F0F1 ATP synthase subunit gamma [Candidatus Daviesbacteria bacterium]|nr:F0F1 ATP synthase subunit gamma [Candidatus Daviesbacteria bacterium]
MTIKQIDAALEEGQSLKQIAQAYSEIANLKIKRIRTEVERNRVFFKEIEGVYALIKNLAVRRKTNITKPKKTISIVLTSNHRFYGNINSDLLKFFVSSTQNLDTDRIMLGKAAIDYFRADPIFKDYQEITLKEDQPDSVELLALTNMVKDYNQVLVFYSSMKSLLVQQPVVTDITASSTLVASDPNLHPQNKEGFKFIFEPDLGKILHFFDSQIITLLIEGTFLESELSRTASRFVSMDGAETQANKFLKDYQLIKAYAKRNMDNNTILENFATMIAVRKEH